MPESFVPLREFFHAAEEPAGEASQRSGAREPGGTREPGGARETAGAEPAGAAEHDASAASESAETHGAFDAVLSELRCFRAVLREMLDAAYERLLRELACGVLARELRLAPVDLLRVARNEIARFEDPRAVRAHPADTASLAPLGIPVRADAGLRRGDLVLELNDGELNASLGARVERVLHALECA